MTPIFDLHKRALLRRAVTWSAVLLAGCTALSPRTELDSLPVARAWAEQPAGREGAKVADMHWRTYFDEPQLLQLIDTALANNRDLRAALLRVEEARALYGIQRAEQFPGVGVGGQMSRARLPAELNPAGRAAVGSEYRVTAGLSSWELDLWGRVRSLKDAALQQYLASEATQDAARVALIAEVASAYLSLRELDERLAVTQDVIASRETSLRIFSRRQEVGSASRLELAQVQTLLHQARSLGAELEQARAAQANALTLLVGTPTALPRRTHTALLGEETLPTLSPGLPSDLLTARADIRAAEQRLRAADANIGAARAAFFPRIALTGDFGTASGALDGLFDGGSRAWSFVPSISLPILDGGRRRAELTLAEVRRDLSVADYEKTIQIAFREVADALSAREWLTRQVAIERDALKAQTDRARLAQLRYDSGAAPYLEVLDAQRALLDAQQKLIQIRSRLLASQVALYAALGGGPLEHGRSTHLPQDSVPRGRPS